MTAICRHCGEPVKVFILTEPDEELEMEVEPCQACLDESYVDGKRFWAELRADRSRE